jgi:alkyldihydroxyacetonephosphate synthase
MRRWNGWGDDATDFPLKAKGLEFLGQKLDGKGTVLPDVGLIEVKSKVAFASSSAGVARH